MSENSNDMTTPQEPIPAQVGEPITPATPLPATAAPAAKTSNVRTYVLAGVSAVVGAALVLGAGVVGYAIGNHDGDNHRSATLTVSGERNGQQDGDMGSGPMMGGDGQRGMDPDGDNWSGQNRDGGMMGGQQGGPMMGGDMGNGIQGFLDQLQNGQGLTSEQQQFLDQLKGFVGGMRNQVG